jgi:tellurite resistance protein TehA-like permease
MLVLSKPVIKGTSLLLWAFGTWWIPPLLVYGVWRHLWARARRYDPAFWSSVFPLRMNGAAGRTVADVVGIGSDAAIAPGVLWVALAAWTVLLAAMVPSLRQPCGVRPLRPAAARVPARAAPNPLRWRPSTARRRTRRGRL